jgi:hypothetical protein
MALTLMATSTITIRMMLEVVGRAQTTVHRCATLDKNEGRGFSSTLGFQNMCRGFFSNRKKEAKLPILTVWVEVVVHKKAIPLSLPLP